MRNNLNRLALLFAFTILSFATTNAQPWTPTGPDDANQLGSYYSFNFHSIASDKGNGMYVVFRDYIPTGPSTIGLRATVRHWDGSVWTTVGAPAFSAGQPDFLDIAVAAGPIPYVVYRDNDNGQKAFAKRFNGTSWVDMGTGLSSGPAESTSIEVDNAGVPYVAFIDAAASNLVAVKKWNGTSWQSVGATNFSPTGISFLQMKIGADNQPRVLVQYYNSVGRTEVFRYTGSAWVSLGFPSSTAAITNLDLAMKGDTAIVAFNDANNGGKMTIRKYDGANWLNIGQANFTTGAIEKIQLAVDTAKGIFVYCNADPTGGSNPTNPMMRRFDGTNWVVVGPDSFISDYIMGQKQAFALDTAGVPFMLVNDLVKHRLLKLEPNGWTEQGSSPGFTHKVDFNVSATATPDGKKAYFIADGDYFSGNPHDSRIYTYDTGWTLISSSANGLKGGTAKKIVMHPDGEPWLVLRDSGSYTMHSIWRHTPAGWVYAGLSDTANAIDMAINGKGEVVVSVAPASSSGLQVHKFSGGAWSQLPTLNPSGVFGFGHIVLGSSGEPYILGGHHISTGPYYLYAFEIIKFNGTSWVTLGSTFNTANGTPNIGDPGIILDAADVPYIVFPNSNQLQAKVQRYDAANNVWNEVVIPGAIPTQAAHPQIQFAPDGALFLYYGDRTTNPWGEVTVKRLSGTSWQTIGNTSFTHSQVLFPGPALVFLNNRFLVMFSDGSSYSYKYDCAQPVTVSMQPGDTAVCTGTAARFVMAASGALSYQWQINNGTGWRNLQNNSTYAGVDDDTLVLSSTATTMDRNMYRCMMTNACGGTAVTDAARLRVDISNWPAPSVSIVADKPSACPGVPITFAAIPVNPGVIYTYSWYVNGVKVNGATDSIYKSAALATGDVVACSFNRLSACGGPALASGSNTIIISPSLPPTVSVSTVPGTIIVEGQLVTFTATFTNGGQTPQFQWMVNGSPVPGANTSTYSSSTLKNGDVVTVNIKRDDTCSTPNAVTSAAITMVVWPVSVQQLPQHGSLVIYPQPAASYINIGNLNSLHAGAYSLRLYDVFGRLIQEEQLTVSNSTNIYRAVLPGSAAPGTYLLRLSGPQEVERTITISR